MLPKTGGYWTACSALKSLSPPILAAKQAGIKTVIIPARNKKDLIEVPEEAKKGIEFVFAKTINDALRTAINTKAKR